MPPSTSRAPKPRLTLQQAAADAAVDWSRRPSSIASNWSEADRKRVEELEAAAS
jgi:hypothetical protein